MSFPGDTRSLVLLALGAFVQEPAPVRPPTALEACAEPDWLAFRVVDAASGRPLSDARLYLLAEEPTPVPGAFRPVRELPCDEDGFVAVPAAEAKDLWLVVRAPGHGPASQLGRSAGRVWPLAPGLDVPVELRDWLDRPVPHARVGFAVGCGHTCDVAWAEADASGVALLRGIDPRNGIADVYPDAPGLGLEDYGGLRWVPGDPPAVVRASFAEAVRGVVLDPAGAPVAHAFVGVRSVHRGPWTATRADGSFQLNGARGDELSVLRADRLDHEYLFELGGKRELTLRLPVADDRKVQVIQAPAAPAEEAPRARSEAPRQEVRVEAPEHARVSLLHEGESRDVTRLVAAGPLSVPARGTVALSIQDDEERRIQVFQAEDWTREPRVRLRFLEPTRLRARLVDPAGNALEATVALLGREVLGDADFDLRTVPGERCADGNLVLEARAEGTRLLALRPAREDLAPRLLPLVLPRRADGAQLDLGPLVLGDAPRLRLLHASERAPGLLRAGWCDVREGLLPGALDAEGGWLGLEPREGDVLLIPDDAWDLGDARAVEPLAIDVPYRARLDGPGPWTLHVPRAELELDVRDENGAPLAALAFVLDRSIAFPGRALLRQLPPGPLELLVVAQGHRSARATVDVPASGRRSLRLTLARR